MKSVMKPATKFRLLFGALIVVSAAQLYMCTSEPSRRAAVDFPREQVSLSAQLLALQNSIDVDLAKTEVQLATSDSDDQERMERVNRALLREKGEVQKAIQNVNNATEVKWASVKKDAKYTLDDTRRTCYKLEKNLKNTLAKK